MFIFVNIWTVSIHDAEYRVMDVLKPFVNGSAHHTDHHLFFNCNYGQFFTLWDRIGGSFKEPTAFSSEDPKSIMKKGELDKKDKNQ
jgi:lathosterol oxidase